MGAILHTLAQTYPTFQLRGSLWVISNPSEQKWGQFTVPKHYEHERICQAKLVPNGNQASTAFCHILNMRSCSVDPPMCTTKFGGLGKGVRVSGAWSKLKLSRL
eukprot:1158085-Pelagomonas_calceolata.AAC.5